MRGLTTNMTKAHLRPYFLWDEDVSIEELRAILAGPEGARRDQLLGKMLREARDLDVRCFVRPIEVARSLERLRRRLGHVLDDRAPMASSPDSKLSPLQVAVIAAFFEREHDFFLTGGAALAGFHLGHRNPRRWPGYFRRSRSPKASCCPPASTPAISEPTSRPW